MVPARVEDFTGTYTPSTYTFSINSGSGQIETSELANVFNPILPRPYPAEQKTNQASAMSIEVKIEIKSNTDLSKLTESLENRTELHGIIATEAEGFLKDSAQYISARNHRTADSLGARRTSHLEQAFEAIEGASDEADARLLIPRASRLRAAFGPYTVKPKSGSKYLTIPVHPDAYGRRAREIADLFVMNRGGGKTPVLARRVEGQKDQALRASPRARRLTTADILYLLLPEVDIPEDRDLIPFDGLAEAASDAVDRWIDDKVLESLDSKDG